MMRRIVILGIALGAAVWLAPGSRVSADSASAPPLLVANQTDRSLSVLDPAAGKEVAAIAEGEVTGHEVEVSRDGRTAYVPIYGNSGVGKPGTDGSLMEVIDVASRKVTGKVDFGHGVRPHCPKINPRDGLLYVTTELDKTVTVIDPKSLKIVGTVPTGQNESHMLAITRDGRRGYTANVGPGTVSVLDLVGRKTITVIPISGMTQRISLSTDDKYVFTADPTKPQLAVIDTATNKVKQWIALPAIGYGTTPTPDGRWLLVAMQPAKQVAVVDLKTMRVARTVDVPAAPTEIVISPDGKRAYASMPTGGNVAEIKLDDWSVGKVIAAGKGADGLAWAK
jgi:YVTN family beta-propeller protein